MARELLDLRAVRWLSVVILTLGVGVAACGDGDDGGGDAPDANAGGSLQFMEMCELTDDQCDRSDRTDMVCFNFNNKGPHCTHPCSGDPDCDNPSPGCNNMGVCKAPD